MSTEFVHLHVHSQYSLLDGAVKVKDLVKRVAASGMRAVAVTDHGNMFGSVTLYKAAKENKVQPIVGCELDVCPPQEQERARGHGHHLPLLAATAEGYRNLVRLVSRGYVAPPAEARAGAAVVAFEDLGPHAKGLVAMTGCMGGLVAQAVLEEGEARGRAMLATLKDVFEPGSLYVELQDHGLPEQPVLNEILIRLARDLELPLVATNDVHYAERADAEAHLYLSCIKTGRSLEEARERHHGSSEMYLKSAEEMAALFGANPEAIRATVEIAEKCALSLKLGEPMLPSFQVPEGYDTIGYFRHVAREGLARRFEETAAQAVDREAYAKRLETELDVIAKMNFAGYFLIVWDFIRHAKESGIPVGPGRGSGAGSIVAYSMRITDLDPIRYRLLFERFLNPERVSMPDFDIDFCMDRRDEVIAYVQRKYGESSVGQIATFAELKSKSVVKDVARCLGITPVEAQQIANLIPRKTPAETYTITEALGVEPKLKQLYDTDARIKELLDQARKLEGLTRHAGKHAAGIVISEGPLWDHVPVFRDERSAHARAATAAGQTADAGAGALITQYHKDDVELAGLVKFDFLGLKTLTVLEVAVRLVDARPGMTEKLDLSRIPLDDAATYRLLGSGETKGVFQLESDGMQKLFKDLRADNFEDIVAAVALYRPGPMGAGMHEDFVRRKHGLAPIASLHPLIDDIVKPTYGVIVYQEQVMQIAQALAGYSLGGADLLRRAMGKKKPEEMAKQKGIFVEGATNKGVEASEAERIFALLEYFAGYGFNKSHSAAYALITYQTAWLKAHYPVELLCAILTSDKDRIEKVVRTIADARAMGITVLPPDINESDTDFKVVYTSPHGDPAAARKRPRAGGKVRDPLGAQIRFGLGAVRGLGGAALEAVFEARRDGPFRDLFNLAARVDAKRVNKGVFEALVQCGAFDTTLEERGVSRSRAFASIDIALERSRAASRDREAGQTTLFGLFDAAPPAGTGASDARSSAPSAGDYVAQEPWDRRELLVRERQSLGFYVSGHPLDRYLKGDGGLAKLEATPIADCAKLDDWAPVKLVGMVEGYRKIFKDGGGKMAFFELEDLTGRLNAKVRAREIEQFAHVLTSGEPMLIEGKVSFPQRADDETEEPEGPREPTVLVNSARPLAAAVRERSRSIAIRVRAERTRSADLASLARVLSAAKGACPVALYVSFDGGAEAVLTLGEAWRVDVGDALLSGIERIFGEQVAELR